MGEGSGVLTVHEAQGLKSEGAIIVWIKAKHKLHDGVPHAVVEIMRHIVSYAYGEDAVDRFIRRALAAIDKKINDNNAKMAIRNRDRIVVDDLEERRGGFLE